ncbi:hypothetical protein LTR70_005428 [Exophiala xenobiotica]|uniref:Uncharacterized protein n=1 Tax=Lithohypha guttulata TaxID=1690604 RepID=A0ABR0K9X4_9EURO|nr:hypothetical protein LTR24_005170 [Lithohypha guttulata]KAK5318406.1 hypothetical protein LTR70_005428 [Exophiala xenobiotica]
MPACLDQDPGTLRVTTTRTPPNHTTTETSTMTTDQIITSSLLTPTLTTAYATLQQTLTLLTFLTTHASAPPTTALHSQVAAHQKQLQAHLSKLRLQTRRAAYTARTTKAQTADARKTVDALLLQLQNLYYEQRHLLGEIASCEDYSHAFQELPLVDGEEYLALFPGQEGLGEEELMGRRIEWEAEERRRMEAERRELVGVKERLVLENARRKEEMKRLDERLEGWVDGLGALEQELKKELE